MTYDPDYSDIEQARECVERVARAICASNIGDRSNRVEENWHKYTRDAHAAVNAMRPAIDAAIMAERERCAKVAESKVRVADGDDSACQITWRDACNHIAACLRLPAHRY